MDKKDIYEHLAKIYLDSSKKHKKKKKKHHELIEAKYLYAAAACLVVGIVAFTFFKTHGTGRKLAPPILQTALVIQPEAIKINYNFDSAKKEILSLQLKGLDVSSYKKIAFSTRKINPRSSISLRVELANEFNERSEAYISDIPQDWKEYEIELSTLKKITNWAHCKEVLFIAEEWNTSEKNDVIYIENVRFIK